MERRRLVAKCTFNKAQLICKYQRTTDAPSLTHFQAALAVPIIGSLKPLQNPNGSLKRNNCRHSRADGDERYIWSGGKKPLQKGITSAQTKEKTNTANILMVLNLEFM